MKHGYLKNVATLRLNDEKCCGCGMCLNVCPHGVFIMNAGKAVITEKDSCMECGACAKNCRFGAIEVKPGVGCAYAIMMGTLLGNGPGGDCSENGNSCC